MQTVFSSANRHVGSTRISWNVERDAEPFGQIWTFTGRGEDHPFHAKTLDDKYATFGSLFEAKGFLAAA